MSKEEQVALEQKRRQSSGEVKADDQKIYGAAAPVILSERGQYIQSRKDSFGGRIYRICTPDNEQIGWMHFNCEAAKPKRANGLSILTVAKILDFQLEDIHDEQPDDDLRAAILAMSVVITKLESRQLRIESDT